MSDINGLYVSGRLVKDAVMKDANGSAIAEITIASNTRIKSQTGIIEETLYIDTSVWGNLALTLAPSLKKGTYVFVSGRLKTNKWVDTATGQNRSRMVLTLKDIRIAAVPGQGAPEIAYDNDPNVAGAPPIPGAPQAVPPQAAQQAAPMQQQPLQQQQPNLEQQKMTGAATVQSVFGGDVVS